MDAPTTDVDTSDVDTSDVDAGDIDPVALDWPGLTDVTAADVDRDAASILEATALDEPGLTDRQRAILDFERRWWRRAGAKEQAIRDQFETSPTRYYQALNVLLELPQAVSYDPTLVHRLQRLRATAARSRRIR